MTTMTNGRPTMPPSDRRRLIAFFTIAFAWTWLLWLPALWRSASIGIPLPTIALLFLTQTLTSGLEEPGWRGFALPLLQRSMTAERADWVLGFVWAAWHLPYML